MGYQSNKSQVNFFKSFAWFISIFFHPLLMPSWLFSCLLFYAPVILNPVTEEGRRNLLLVIFISTCLLPLLILLTLILLTRSKLQKKDFLMVNKSERIVPFFFTGFYYLALSYFLFSNINSMLFVIMLCISGLIILLAVITAFWKISAHSYSIGGFLGFLLALSYLFPTAELLIPTVAVVLVAGLILSARVFLRAHNNPEVYLGFVVGLATSFTFIYFSIFKL